MSSASTPSSSQLLSHSSSYQNISHEQQDQDQDQYEMKEHTNPRVSPRASHHQHHPSNSMSSTSSVWSMIDTMDGTISMPPTPSSAQLQLQQQQQQQPQSSLPISPQCLDAIAAANVTTALHVTPYRKTVTRKRTYSYGRVNTQRDPSSSSSASLTSPKPFSPRRLEFDPSSSVRNNNNASPDAPSSVSSPTHRSSPPLCLALLPLTDTVDPAHPLPLATEEVDFSRDADDEGNDGDIDADESDVPLEEMSEDDSEADLENEIVRDRVRWYTPAGLWVQFLLVIHLAFKLGSVLGMSWKWMIMLMRLVIFSIVMAPAWVLIGRTYFSAAYIKRSVRYGLNARNYVDLYMPHRLMITNGATNNASKSANNSSSNLAALTDEQQQHLCAHHAEIVRRKSMDGLSLVERLHLDALLNKIAVDVPGVGTGIEENAWRELNEVASTPTNASASTVAATGTTGPLVKGDTAANFAAEITSNATEPAPTPAPTVNTTTSSSAPTPARAASSSKASDAPLHPRVHMSHQHAPLSSAGSSFTMLPSMTNQRMHSHSASPVLPLPSHTPTLESTNVSGTTSPVTAPLLAPVVIFLTGGAWSIGYKAWGALLGLGLSAHGILVASVDYRNFPQGDVSDMVRDVHTAIAWVFRHCGEYGGDASRVFIVGQSAGAHLGALAVLENVTSLLRGHRVPWTSHNLAGFVGISGCYDLANSKLHFHARGLPSWVLMKMMNAQTDEDLARWSPIYFTRSSVFKTHSRAFAKLMPPMLLIHGKGDKTVSWRASHEFAQVLMHAKVRVKARYYKNYSHTDPIIEGPLTGHDHLCHDLLFFINERSNDERSHGHHHHHHHGHSSAAKSRHTSTAPSMPPSHFGSRNNMSVLASIAGSPVIISRTISPPTLQSSPALTQHPVNSASMTAIPSAVTPPQNAKSHQADACISRKNGLSSSSLVALPSSTTTSPRSSSQPRLKSLVTWLTSLIPSCFSTLPSLLLPHCVWSSGGRERRPSHLPFPFEFVDDVEEDEADLDQQDELYNKQQNIHLQTDTLTKHDSWLITLIVSLMTLTQWILPLFIQRLVYRLSSPFHRFLPKSISSRLFTFFAPPSRMNSTRTSRSSSFDASPISKQQQQHQYQQSNNNSATPTDSNPFSPLRADLPPSPNLPAASSDVPPVIEELSAGVSSPTQPRYTYPLQVASQLPRTPPQPLIPRVLIRAARYINPF